MRRKHTEVQEKHCLKNVVFRRTNSSVEREMAAISTIKMKRETLPPSDGSFADEPVSPSFLVSRTKRKGSLKSPIPVQARGSAVIRRHEQQRPLSFPNNKMHHVLGIPSQVQITTADT